MANRSCRKRQRYPEAPSLPVPPPEPAVHRWPHPIPQPYAPPPEESALHYIRCALSYQNEMLSEIKTLLEQLATDQADSQKE